MRYCTVNKRRRLNRFERQNTAARAAICISDLTAWQMELQTIGGKICPHHDCDGGRGNSKTDATKFTIAGRAGLEFFKDGRIFIVDGRKKFTDAVR